MNLSTIDWAACRKVSSLRVKNKQPLPVLREAKVFTCNRNSHRHNNTFSLLSFSTLIGKPRFWESEATEIDSKLRLNSNHKAAILIELTDRKQSLKGGVVAGRSADNPKGLRRERERRSFHNNGNEILGLIGN